MTPANFKIALQSLTGPLETPMAIAVSGGPDSLALLLLAHAAFPGQVRALTVDHALRAGSADEAAGVAALCAARGIAHTTLVWMGPKPGGNIQAAARTARYGMMCDWCAAQDVPWLATAHHRDDVAETLLLRLARGAGIAGLHGPRARRPLGQGVTLLRPLLATSHAHLCALVADAGLPAIDDPSNHALRFDRTAARALLAATPWLDPERLAASVAHLADADVALDWTTDLAWDSRCSVSEGEVSLFVEGLPLEITRRLLLRGIAVLNPGATPRGPDIVRLLSVLAAGHSATLAGVKARGGARWQLRVETRKAPPPGQG